MSHLCYNHKLEVKNNLKYIFKIFHNKFHIVWTSTAHLVNFQKTQDKHIHKKILWVASIGKKGELHFGQVLSNWNPCRKIIPKKRPAKFCFFFLGGGDFSGTPADLYKFLWSKMHENPISTKKTPNNNNNNKSFLKFWH